MILSSCKVDKSDPLDFTGLVQSNEIQRIAHLENDADRLVSQIADTMISVSRGQIQPSTNKEIKDRFDQYFSQVKYTSWDDTQVPIIHISEDGSAASVYVEKLLDVQYRNQDGELGEHNYSLFAWNSEYQRLNNEWKIVGITSTDKTLTEEEALQLPVHLSEDYASISELDLIPEGVAYDPTSGTTFLSSTYKQKIVAIRPDGSYYDFKDEKQDELWSTVGMEVDEKRNRLWVVSFNGNEVLPMKYPDPETEWTSRIYAYQLPDGELIETYQPDIDGQVAFNDLCVDSKGGVYITESLKNRVYYLNPENGSFKMLSIQDSSFVFPNGISVSDDQSFLYITTQNGIMQYDLGDDTYSFLSKPSGIVDIHLDGLAYFKGTLIGNQPFRNRIIQFSLDEQNGVIKSQRILEANHPDFDQPSTGEIADGYFIYLANAQMSSGFENGVLRSKDELEAVKLLKVKLPN